MQTLSLVCKLLSILIVKIDKSRGYLMFKVLRTKKAVKLITLINAKRGLSVLKNCELQKLQVVTLL